MVAMILTGDEEARRYITELPKRIQRSLNRGNLSFMKRVQKSAKLRAPRMSGELAESISLNKTKTKGMINRYQIIVESPYGIYQEMGYTPHYINAGWSTKNRLGMVGDAYGGKFEVAKVSKYKPFIAPAIEANIAYFNAILDSEITKAIK